MSRFDLTGQTLLVTGGARGIGLAIATAACEHGAAVILADINAPAAKAAATRLTEQGYRALGTAVDVAKSQSVETLFDEAEAAVGPITAVINNAGISARIPAEEYPDDELDRIIDINIKGVYYVMRAAARRWIARSTPGRIVNLASFAGVVADPLSAPYAATKGAVVQLTRTCAVEWALHGILVNAIGPGYVRTEMTAHTLDTPEAGAAIRAKTALGRAATPDEIAGAAIFLCSAASTYVTGHILMVDGGWTAM